MSEVFISYRRNDQPAVARLVNALRSQGVDVWWDQDIRPSAPWEETIEHELETARVTIVVWSPDAVVSDNVKAEARRAKGAGKLIQVFVAECKAPLFFGEQQGLSLIGWQGDTADPRFRTLLAAISAVASGKTPPRGVGHARRGRPAWWTGGGGALLASTFIGLTANVGGVRDGLCNIAAIKAACVRMGLVSSAPDPAALAAEARSRLIKSLAGAWDRQDRSCADPITIATAVDPDGTTRITVSNGKGFASKGEIIAADSGVVVSRNSTPTASGAREQWEYRPHGDAMTVLDKDGVSTTLVRCPAASG